MGLDVVTYVKYVYFLPADSLSVGLLVSPQVRSTVHLSAQYFISLSIVFVAAGLNTTFLEYIDWYVPVKKFRNVTGFLFSKSCR